MGLSHGPPPAFLLNRWPVAVHTDLRLFATHLLPCKLIHMLLKQPHRLFTAPRHDQRSLPLAVESLLSCVELSSPGLALDKGRESFTADHNVWNSPSDSLDSKYAATSLNQGSDDFPVGVVNLGCSHPFPAPETRRL